MNTAQANRLMLISERARRFNNYADCDIIQQGIEMVENADSKKAIESIDYLINAILYRGGEHTADLIKELKMEFLAYESLAKAIKLQNKYAIAYFEKEAKEGVVIRIM